jgi:hypothetical protein
MKTNSRLLLRYDGTLDSYRQRQLLATFSLESTQSTSSALTTKDGPRHHILVVAAVSLY